MEKEYLETTLNENIYIASKSEYDLSVIHIFFIEIYLLLITSHISNSIFDLLTVVRISKSKTATLYQIE